MGVGKDFSLCFSIKEDKGHFNIPRNVRIDFSIIQNETTDENVFHIIWGGL